ncbi:hypothetical protein HDU79_011409 [Rhizoclosmatium sp. JEL0117]|nr:hypothetical protein HDU79_011409 [Rhizoclosmatium sp. JEL0117]
MRRIENMLVILAIIFLCLEGWWLLNRAHRNGVTVKSLLPFQQHKRPNIDVPIEIAKKMQRSKELQWLERTIDLDQAQILDYLQGTPVILNETDAFGFRKKFDVVSTWNRVHRYAQQQEFTGYRYEYTLEVEIEDRKETFTQLRANFLWMTRRIRANTIAYLLLHDNRNLQQKLVSSKNQQKLQQELQSVVAKFSDLYYWYKDRSKTIRVMHDRFLNVTGTDKESGIVMSGGANQFRSLVLTIRALREIMKCTLPIEVHYAGDTDLPMHLVEELKKLPGVDVVDLKQSMPYEMRVIRGWSVKPFAILNSSFRKVIFIDADVLFFQDPAVILTKSPIFRQYGQLFFSDRSLDRGNGTYTEWFNEINPYRTQYASKLRFANALSWHEMESGVVALDKGNVRILHALYYACKMNAKDIRDETYTRVWGDKETFWLSFELLRVPYVFVPTYSGAIGYKDGAKVCGNNYHVDETLKPFWWNSGIMMTKNATKSNDMYMRFEYAAFDSDRDTLKWEWEHNGTPFCVEPLYPEKEVIALDKQQKDIGAAYIRLDKEIKALYPEPKDEDNEL